MNNGNLDIHEMSESEENEQYSVEELSEYDNELGEEDFRRLEYAIENKHDTFNFTSIEFENETAMRYFESTILERLGNKHVTHISFHDYHFPCTGLFSLTKMFRKMKNLVSLDFEDIHTCQNSKHIEKLWKAISKLPKLSAVSLDDSFIDHIQTNLEFVVKIKSLESIKLYGYEMEHCFCSVKKDLIENSTIKYLTLQNVTIEDHDQDNLIEILSKTKMPLEHLSLNVGFDCDKLEGIRSAIKSQKGLTFLGVTGEILNDNLSMIEESSFFKNKTLQELRVSDWNRHFNEMSNITMSTMKGIEKIVTSIDSKITKLTFGRLTDEIVERCISMIKQSSKLKHVYSASLSRSYMNYIKEDGHTNTQCVTEFIEYYRHLNIAKILFLSLYEHQKKEKTSLVKDWMESRLFDVHLIGQVFEFL